MTLGGVLWRQRPFPGKQAGYKGCRACSKVL